MAAAASTLRPVGVVRSSLRSRKDAPRQGGRGAPNAWVDIAPEYAGALLGLGVGQEVLLFTWLHLAERKVLQVHPGSDRSRPIAGVFATRSPDRPNPVGLHPVTILQIDGLHLEVGPLEAIDGTPVIDIKPVL